MNRIGHASRPNSAMNWTRSPSVTAPDETRHEPTARSADRADRGERLQRRLEPRADEPGLDPLVLQRAGLDRQPLGLVGLPPERLHDHRAVDALVRDGGDLADPLLGAPRGPFHPPGEAAVHQRERREQQDADHREVQVGREQRDQREQDQEEHAGRERDGVQDVHGRLDVGLHVRDQLAGRRLLVELEREIAVPVGDPRAERGHHARAGHAAVVPADHDAERAERARRP